MHRVVVDKGSSDKRLPQSRGDRDHTAKLIQMLSCKMDSIARNELFKRYAAEHGMRGHSQLFEQAEKRDRAHVNWLKEQILRSIR